MNKQNKVEVNLCGKSLMLISNESTDYILEIADYVNKKMDEMKNIHNFASKSLLLSVNIADELFKQREKNLILEREITKLKTELAKINYKLSQRKDELKKSNKD